MKRDQVKGRLKEAEGEIKKDAGKLAGNTSLEAEGNVDKASGKTCATSKPNGYVSRRSSVRCVHC